MKSVAQGNCGAGWVGGDGGREGEVTSASNSLHQLQQQQHLEMEILNPTPDLLSTISGMQPSTLVTTGPSVRMMPAPLGRSLACAILMPTASQLNLTSSRASGSIISSPV